MPSILGKRTRSTTTIAGTLNFPDLLEDFLTFILQISKNHQHAQNVNQSQKYTMTKTKTLSLPAGGPTRSLTPMMSL